jgi:hypothetical protein
VLFVIDCAVSPALLRLARCGWADAVYPGPATRAAAQVTEDDALVRIARRAVGERAPVFIDVDAATPAEFLERATAVRALGSAVYPACAPGAGALEAVANDARAGRRWLVRSVTSARQAILAAKSGAGWIALDLAAIEQRQLDGPGVVHETVVALRAAFVAPPLVFAGGMPTAARLPQCAAAGADGAILAPPQVEQAVASSMTDAAESARSAATGITGSADTPPATGSSD